MFYYIERSSSIWNNARHSLPPRQARRGSTDALMSTTITKALTLVEALAEREEPWSVSELARRLTLSKSNVHFLLAALCARGYVEQEAATKRYFLTLKLWELGTRALGRLDLRRIASPYLASLAECTSETVNLAILDHGEVVYVHKIDSPMPVRAYTPEGILRREKEHHRARTVIGRPASTDDHGR